MNAGAFRIKDAGIEERVFAGGCAVNNDAPEIAKAFDALGDVRAAEHLENGVDTFAVRQIFYGVDVILLLVVDAVLQAEFAYASEFIFRGRRAVHFDAENFADLDCGGADSASDGMNEYASAGLVEQARFPVGEISGEEIYRESSSLFGGPIFGDGPKQIAIGGGLLCERCPLGVAHDAASGGRFASGEFASGGERRIGSGCVSSLGGHQVGKVQTAGFDVDQNLVGRGMRSRELLDFENFRSAETSDDQGFHGERAFIGESSRRVGSLSWPSASIMRQRPASSCRLSDFCSMPLTDNFGRSIHDLRISITDRCNYKCVYCRTGTNGAAYAELPFDDYLRMARILVGLGITKIRLTGGEPLLRKGIVEFVRELAKLRTGDGKKPEIALTTNGHLLAEIAQPLKDAGLDRVTVSMDAVDPERFARITRVPNGYEKVLAGVRASRRAGLDPVKVNCVLLRGFNEDQIIPFGMFAREEGVVVRFIEFMPLEEDRVWTPQIVVTLDEILARMAEYLPLQEIAHERSETARRYRFSDGVGEFGIIAPVSHPFCGHCSRIRITSDGKLRTCLFSVWDHDLHELMRRGASDEKLADFILNVVQKKEERHHIGEPGFVPASRTMVHIGG